MRIALNIFTTPICYTIECVLIMLAQFTLGKLIITMPSLNKKSRPLPWITKVKKSNKSWSYSKVYGTKRWKQTRALKLELNPLCEECETLKNVTPATVVDHIEPILEGGAPYDMDNLQSLCASHHNRKTGKNKKNV